MTKKEDTKPAGSPASTPATERQVLQGTTQSRGIPEFRAIQPERGTPTNWSAATDKTKSQVLQGVTEVAVDGEIRRVETALGIVDTEEAAIKNLYLEGCRKTECDPLKTSFDPELKKKMHRLAVLYPAGFLRAVQGVFWSEEAKIDPPEGLYEAELVLEILADALDNGTHKEFRKYVWEWRKMDPVTLETDPALWRQIESIAQERGQSVGATVRKMLDEAVSKQKEAAA